MTTPSTWQGDPVWQDPQYLPQAYYPTYDPDGPHDRYHYAEPPWGPPDAPPGYFAVAHLGKRLLARVIDVLIVVPSGMAPFVAVAWSLEPGTTAESSIAVFALLTVFGGYFLYDGVQNALWSRTLGKRLMRLRVASADAPHLPLSRGSAFGRAALYPMGFTFLGMLPMVGLIATLDSFSPLWDRPRRQAWHDRMAKTVVLNDRRS